MAVRGISFAEKHWFVSKDDDGQRPSLEESREAGATIFWWKAIPNVVMARIADHQSSSSVTVGDMMTQTFNQRTAARNRDSFRYGITTPAFENFHDDKGQPIFPVFTHVMEGGASYEVLSEDTMNQIPLHLVQEVGSHIFNSNSLGEEGRKKLEAALSPSADTLNSSVTNAMPLPDENEDASEAQSSTDENQTPSKKSTTGGPTPSPKKSKIAAPAD